MEMSSLKMINLSKTDGSLKVSGFLNVCSLLTFFFLRADFHLWVSESIENIPISDKSYSSDCRWISQGLSESPGYIEEIGDLFEWL